MKNSTKNVYKSFANAELFVFWLNYKLRCLPGSCNLVKQCDLDISTLFRNFIFSFSCTFRVQIYVQKAIIARVIKYSNINYCLLRILSNYSFSSLEISKMFKKISNEQKSSTYSIRCLKTMFKSIGFSLWLCQDGYTHYVIIIYI